IQGSRLPNAFRQNQPGSKTSGRDVVGRMAELPVKAIQKPIRSRACDVWEGHTRFPLARSEDSIRYLREFSGKITEASSNSRHYTNRARPMLTSSHDAQFVLKAPCQDNNLRTDVEEGAKDGVVVLEGRVDWNKLDRLAGHNKDRFQDPTSNLPSEGSAG